MNIIELINDFIDDKYTLKTFREALSYINNFNLIKEEQNFKDLDKAIHAYLIILFNYYDKIDFSEESNNECFQYLQEILEYSNSFNFITIYEEENKLIINVDKLYFIINNTNVIINFELPLALQNKTVFCINCNDEMKLKNAIKLPDYSFYAFLDE